MSPGVEPGLFSRASNSLTTAPQCHSFFGDFIFVILKPFFPAVDAVRSWGSCIYLEFKDTLRKISLSAYFEAFSHYFGFRGPIDVDNR